MTTTLKIERDELVRLLRARDGDACQYPGCETPVDFEADNDPFMATLDHWMPQVWCKSNGWTGDQIWDLSNLKIMHRRCNADKGERLPNADGTLPPKPISRFKFRRMARAERPEICESCQSGRLLGEGEWCNSCGSGPNPGRFPKWRQMQVKECDHDLFYCVACTIWFPEYRRSALDALITGGDGYE